MENTNYFTDASRRAAQAYNHTLWCDGEYKSAITKSFKTSQIYGDGTGITTEYTIRKATEMVSDKNIKVPVIKIIPTDSVTALYRGSDTTHYTILNFASYKEPGGKFLKGSKAQEECLCHESFLYNVLEKFTGYYEFNKRNLKNGLYLNRAIYSPDIIFNRNNVEIFADVITCAAPNWRTVYKYSKIIPYEYNLQVFADRMKFVMECCLDHAIKDNTKNSRGLILGAYGCGVFGQDATFVANTFKNLINDGYACMFDEIIFAIPLGQNYDDFNKVKF